MYQRESRRQDAENKFPHFGLFAKEGIPARYAAKNSFIIFIIVSTFKNHNLYIFLKLQFSPFFLVCFYHSQDRN